MNVTDYIIRESLL